MRLVLKVVLAAATAVWATPMAQATEDVVDVGASAVTKEQLTRSLKVVKKDRAVSMEVTFAFGSATLTPDATERLDVLADALAAEELRGTSFLIEGHTDAAGNDTYNLALSERRASAVRDYVLSKGAIDPTRIEAVGRGETALLHPDDPLAAANRRVQIVARAPKD